MSLHAVVGKSINEPIRSNNAVGDVRLLWDNVQLQRLKGLQLTASDGTTLPYTLLYYIPGLTTYCGVRGRPVLTGYMSGCYLLRFKRHGEMRVAHIGTHDTLAEWSDKAKNAWKAYVARPHITEVFGFDPINDISDSLMSRAASTGSNPQIIGAWEGNGGARIGIVVNDPAQAGRRIIVGFENAPLRPWHEIQNDRKMA